MPMYSGAGVVMSEAAREVKKDPVALEGFENLLEQRDTGIEPAQEAVQESATMVQESAPEDVDLAQEVLAEAPEGYWTTEEAAKHLGVSQRTIFKRLKEGVIKGIRVQGKYRVEWRIEPVETSIPGIEVAFEDDDEIRSSYGADQEGAPERAQTLREQASGASLRLQELESLLGVIREKDQLLQAATYRNGYLEAQLAYKEQEIKLLTDSQHKRDTDLQTRDQELKQLIIESQNSTGWQRFWSWLAGSGSGSRS
jgi:excisionase family DNA binding protein